MSFFKRFTQILKGKGQVAPAAPAKIEPKPAAVKIDTAAAEAKAREIILEAKNQAFEIKQQVTKQETELGRRLGAIEQREKSVSGQESHWRDLINKAEMVRKEQVTKLERIAKLSQSEAHDLILKLYSRRLTRETAEIIRDAEAQAKAEAEEKAREILIEAMRHGATDYVAEYTVSLVKVADEDAKGRVIGREGRNIRTFEKVSGVEVDLDEAGVIRLSCFDPVRREIARVALEKLIADGRIQPSRIEETVAHVKKDLDRIIRQEGERLCHSVKVFNLPIEIIDMLGRFKYRFSYGQNMIQHTLEETQIGLKLAYETGADPNIVRLGCLLHDIGKVIDEEEGTHVELAVKFLQSHRIPQAVIDCVAEHHEDKPFSSIESMLVYIADAISGARPGARYADHEGYLKRMTQLEEIAKSFEGVESAYAIQAGREVRVMVKPEVLNDDQSVKLTSDIRDKIKDAVKNFPGQIKVTVIRERRSEAIAS
jgi:ribonuclease Y